ncbi:hypothetical protein DY000_02059055 [Brassica cretica]|uniref:LOB domain-containing protein n=1 Tax=Brassica cretica TaxID=69181 RepID=A0ABQ7B0T7_BRACR|nr:hypothetical protein DY000_02059055 [Brassica cretica]
MSRNQNFLEKTANLFWERLQEGNPDFFEEYYKRCEVARQIAAFNDLLAQRVDLMHKLREIELSNVAPDQQVEYCPQKHDYTALPVQQVPPQSLASLNSLILVMDSPTTTAQQQQQGVMQQRKFAKRIKRRRLREAGFTEQRHLPLSTVEGSRAVWERLQEGNPDFFEEYYKRCEVARQIAAFNDLLAQQVDLMHKLREIELSNVAPEQFTRELDQQQQILQLKSQQPEHLTDQQVEYCPQKHDYTTLPVQQVPAQSLASLNSLDFGDGLTNNNGSTATTGSDATKEIRKKNQ